MLLLQPVPVCPHCFPLPSRPASGASVKADPRAHLLHVLRRSALSIKDVAVGEGRQQSMHTNSVGEAGAPPLVLLPGYGAGAGFYFRNLDGLAQHFRVHAVDLLGTGMSGAQERLFWQESWQNRDNVRLRLIILAALNSVGPRHVR